MRYVPLYTDILDMMQFMKPIQVGNVILALREYVMTGKRVALKTQGEQMAIDMLIKRYDADQKAYEEKCETNKRIAEERQARKAAKKAETARTCTNVDERARTYTNINKSKIKEKEKENKNKKNNNACADACACADAQETTGTESESAADMMRRWNELTGRKDGEE